MEIHHFPTVWKSLRSIDKYVEKRDYTDCEATNIILKIFADGFLLLERGDLNTVDGKELVNVSTATWELTAGQVASLFKKTLLQGQSILYDALDSVSMVDGSGTITPKESTMNKFPAGRCLYPMWLAVDEGYETILSHEELVQKSQSLKQNVTFYGVTTLKDTEKSHPMIGKMAWMQTLIDAKSIIVPCTVNVSQVIKGALSRFNGLTPAGDGPAVNVKDQRPSKDMSDNLNTTPSKFQTVGEKTPVEMNSIASRDPKYMTPDNSLAKGDIPCVNKKRDHTDIITSTIISSNIISSNSLSNVASSEGLDVKSPPKKTRKLSRGSKAVCQQTATDLEVEAMDSELFSGEVLGNLENDVLEDVNMADIEKIGCEVPSPDRYKLAEEGHKMETTVSTMSYKIEKGGSVVVPEVVNEVRKGRKGKYDEFAPVNTGPGNANSVPVSRVPNSTPAKSSPSKDLSIRQTPKPSGKAKPSPKRGQAKGKQKSLGAFFKSK